MKKNNYQRPTMKVVMLKQRTHLLQVSGEKTSVTANRSSYVSATPGTDYEQEWD